jgi:hypothetical protein
VTWWSHGPASSALKPSDRSAREGHINHAQLVRVREGLVRH